MNDIKIFENAEFGSVRTLENARKKDEVYFGYVYALEWENKVKIGCTRNIATRIQQLRKIAEYGGVEVGRVVISPLHSNYTENEKALHNTFKNMRVGKTELFQVGLSDVMTAMYRLSFLKIAIANENGDGDGFVEFMKDVLQIREPMSSLSEEKERTIMTNSNYSNFYIKLRTEFGTVINIPIESDGIWTKCPICGKEHEVSLDTVIDPETLFLQLE